MWLALESFLFIAKYYPTVWYHLLCLSVSLMSIHFQCSLLQTELLGALTGTSLYGGELSLPW